MTRNSTPLRNRLLLLAFVGILPVAAMSGLALFELGQQQRRQVERTALDIARALSTAVDVELQHSVMVLRAAGTALDHMDLEAFSEFGRGVIATQPTWWALVMHDPSGTPVFHSGYPLGASMPDLVEPKSLERLLSEPQELVGQLAGGAIPRIPVRVPVMRDGQLAFVLTALIRPDGMLSVVRRQQLPADWLISVFDATGARVARSRRHDEFLGRPPADSLAALMNGGREGTGVAETLEGDAIHAAFSRSAVTGFVVSVGIPIAQADAGVARSLTTYGGGLLLSLVLGALAALVVGRGVTRPMDELRRAAEAVGRRSPVRVSATSIEELRQIGDALVSADAERARSEAERDDLLRREREARAYAEAANRAKDEFLAMLGHELRNPLGAIGNASRLLDDPRVDETTAARARAIIARQVAHMARLTDDLLDAARALAGKIVLQRGPMNLADAAAHVVSARWGDAGASRRVVEDLHPVWVHADRTRIEQVIGNLLVNAVKYSLEGGTVAVSVLREGDDAVLRVADDGIGMDEALLARVFEPFVQGTRELDRQHGGLGIGLTLVRRLVELHGGTVEARSEGPGRGSEFVVRLPAILPPLDAEPPHSTRFAQARRRVLLVEDNDDARESLSRLLELEGHEVTACSDGPAALDAVRAARPDVAFVDLGLPGMDGYEVARRIRAEPGDAVRLVALTGYGADADRRRTRAAGFDLHLVKPVELATLRQALTPERRMDGR
jgi:signal transduction histidine kinase/CheY-like chemotaxis protein